MSMIYDMKRNNPQLLIGPPMAIQFKDEKELETESKFTDQLQMDENGQINKIEEGSNASENGRKKLQIDLIYNHFSNNIPNTNCNNKDVS